jgi:hypothetical protein
MFCRKCQKNEAAIHFTPVVNGKAKKPVHLCRDCAPAEARSHTLDPKKPATMPVKGKCCEFCGRPARYGGIVSGETVYTCADCATELRDIMLDLCSSERPQLMERIEGTVTFISRDTPDVRAWLKAANQKAIDIIRARRRQPGRGPS